MGHVKNNEVSQKSTSYGHLLVIVVFYRISSTSMYQGPRKRGNVRILETLFFDHSVTHLLHYF